MSCSWVPLKGTRVQHAVRYSLRTVRISRRAQTTGISISGVLRRASWFLAHWNTTSVYGRLHILLTGSDWCRVHQTKQFAFGTPKLVNVSLLYSILMTCIASLSPQTESRSYRAALIRLSMSGIWRPATAFWILSGVRVVMCGQSHTQQMASGLHLALVMGRFGFGICNWVISPWARCGSMQIWFVGSHFRQMGSKLPRVQSTEQSSSGIFLPTTSSRPHLLFRLLLQPLPLLRLLPILRLPNRNSCSLQRLSSSVICTGRTF